jgi:hypothetical protein
MSRSVDEVADMVSVKKHTRYMLETQWLHGTGIVKMLATGTGIFNYFI